LEKREKVESKGDWITISIGSR